MLHDEVVVSLTAPDITVQERGDVHIETITFAKTTFLQTTENYSYFLWEKAKYRARNLKHGSNTQHIGTLSFLLYKDYNLLLQH